ncbi:hypothetical protein bcere0022_30960 [Bacillus cereus Rock3-44]|nr:hypothetical protein bcere0022_30960 [Bacillus cereus Rock3-44]
MESFTLFLFIIPYFSTNDKFSDQFVSQKQYSTTILFLTALLYITLK